MKLQVKEVSGNEKSKAEIEEQLLQKHEETTSQEKPEAKVEEVKVEAPEQAKEVETKEVENTSKDIPESSGVNDDNVLSYIKERYNKDIESVDQLFETKESNEKLPEDVLKYFEYKKETGRGIEDFYKLQKDYDSMDGDQLLADYYGVTEEGLDAIDIQDMMEDKFSFDEDLDEPKDIKKIKLAKKRELAKAKKFFNEQKDKYQAPLESSGGKLSDEQEKNLNAYKSYIEESKTVEEANEKRYDYFLDKTEKVFNDEFKGFKFNVGEKEMSYKPGTAQELKNKQKDVNTWLNTFMNDKGLIENTEGYHKSLSVAMNPDKFAKFFYEQGVAAAVDNVTKKSKNINMEVRSSPQSFQKDGLKIRTVGNTDSGRGLKIRSIK